MAYILIELTFLLSLQRKKTNPNEKIYTLFFLNHHEKLKPIII